jgi:hypothetical protein
MHGTTNGSVKKLKGKLKTVLKISSLIESTGLKGFTTLIGILSITSKKKTRWNTSNFLMSPALSLCQSQTRTLTRKRKLQALTNIDAKLW